MSIEAQSNADSPANSRVYNKGPSINIPIGHLTPDYANGVNIENIQDNAARGAEPDDHHNINLSPGGLNGQNGARKITLRRFIPSRGSDVDSSSNDRLEPRKNDGMIRRASVISIRQAKAHLMPSNDVAGSASQKTRPVTNAQTSSAIPTIVDKNNANWEHFNYVETGPSGSSDTPATMRIDNDILNPNIEEALRDEDNAYAAEELLNNARTAVLIYQRGEMEVEWKGKSVSSFDLGKSLSLGSFQSFFGTTDDDPEVFMIPVRYHDVDCKMTFSKKDVVCTNHRGKIVARKFPLPLQRVLVITNLGKNIHILGVPERILKIGPKLQFLTVDALDEIIAEEWARKCNMILCNGRFADIVCKGVLLLVDEADSAGVHKMIDSYLLSILRCLGKPFTIQVVSRQRDLFSNLNYNNRNVIIYLTIRHLPDESTEAALLGGALVARGGNATDVRLLNMRSIDPVDLALEIIKGNKARISPYCAFCGP
ncbi:hypothetical protein DFS34DRAFT_658631 [Phlyctochytrium arcticum]|nr:hypothetical protein DFS34DRAFT_658631 [Phlyctochytrium arcticum]